MHERQYVRASVGGLMAAIFPPRKQTCGGPAGSTSAIWFPDLRRDESLVDIDVLVKF